MTYLLPNWTEDGLDYEDTRFLSNNAMTEALIEDNTPPNDVDDTEAIFTSNENGTGTTTITWSEVYSEENENTSFIDTENISVQPMILMLN